MKVIGMLGIILMFSLLGNIYLYFELDLAKYEIELREDLINSTMSKLRECNNVLENDLEQLKTEINKLETENKVNSKVLNENLIKYQRDISKASGDIADDIMESIIEKKVEDLSFNIDTRDREYNLYSLEKYQEVYNLIDFPEYEPEVYDCDDYTLEFMVEARKKLPGASIGYLSIVNESSAHAVNIIVDNEINIWYFDAQNGKFKEFKDFREYTNYTEIREVWF